MFIPLKNSIKRRIHDGIFKQMRQTRQYLSLIDQEASKRKRPVLLVKSNIEAREPDPLFGLHIINTLNPLAYLSE